MSQLRQCNLCKNVIKDECGLPGTWTSLSMITTVGNNMKYAQIDICDACKRTIMYDYDVGAHFNKTGELKSTNVTKLQGSRIRQVLRFILEGTDDI